MIVPVKFQKIDQTRIAVLEQLDSLGGRERQIESAPLDWLAEGVHIDATFRGEIGRILNPAQRWGV